MKAFLLVNCRNSTEAVEASIASTFGGFQLRGEKEKRPRNREPRKLN